MKKVLLSSIVLLAVSFTVSAQKDTKAKAKPAVKAQPKMPAASVPAPQFKNLTG